MTRLPAVHCAAVIAFMVMAAAGLAFMALGPVALIRIFGLVALVSAAAGCAVHALLVRAEAPGCWQRLIARFWSRSAPVSSGFTPASI